MSDKVGYDKDKGTSARIDFTSYLRAARHEQKAQPSTRIALVVVEGEIVDGESDNDTAGGDTISGLLEDARHEDEVKAVLLRIKLARRQRHRIREDPRASNAGRTTASRWWCRCPPLAASGGYWISMAATRSGRSLPPSPVSIGIFGLIPPSTSAEQAPASTRRRRTTPLAGAFRSDRPAVAGGQGHRAVQHRARLPPVHRRRVEGRNIPVDKVTASPAARLERRRRQGPGPVGQPRRPREAEAAAAQAGRPQVAYRIEELQPQRDLLAQWLGRSSAFGMPTCRSSKCCCRSTTHCPAGAGYRLLFSRFNDPNNAYVYCFARPPGRWDALRELARCPTPNYGRRLHYEEAGAGPPLVLLHASAPARQDGNTTVPAFARHYRVITPELRGSARASVRQLRRRHLCRRHLGLLELLQVERFNLIGHSMGGRWPCRWAVDRPERIERLIAGRYLPSFRTNTFGSAPVRLPLTYLMMGVLGPQRLSRAVAGKLFPGPHQQGLRERATAGGMPTTAASIWKPCASCWAGACWSSWSRLTNAGAGAAASTTISVGDAEVFARPCTTRA